MARAYYSTVFEQDADRVWAAIRDFGNYDIWIEGVDESRIEEGKPGDAVGAVRSVRLGETRIRQRLLAHSDKERCYTYESCPPHRFPVRDYEATIRVTPITDGNRSLVEWWATFDCAPGEYAHEYAHWTGFFATSFAGWLGSLRKSLVRRAA